MAETAVVMKPEPLKLPSSRLELAEVNRLRMAVTMPVGWKFEECLKPEFWSQVAYRFQKSFDNKKDWRGRIIEIYTDDDAWYAEVYVKAVRERDIIVKVVTEPISLDAVSVNTAAYEVRWNVGKRAFDIVRLSDNEIVGDAKSKDLAAEWIAKTTGKPVAKAA